MKGVDFMPVVQVSGSYGDMGVEYGRRAAELIAQNFDDYLRRFRLVAHLTDSEVERAGDLYRGITRRYSADVADMLDGVAEGADQKAANLYALNARTEILYGVASKPSADGGCTSIAVLPKWTRNRHALLGQNWDWHPEQKHITLLLWTRDEDGFEVLSLAEAGMLAKSGLNSAGLGVCANLLVSGDDHGGEGVPYHILLRGVLQSHSMADAIRAVTVPTRVSSGNFLIADTEEAIDIEAAPADFGYLLPEQGVITHSNHFLTGTVRVDRRKPHSALTLLRPARARHLLEGSVDQRTVTIDDLMAVFRDHYSYPNGICRHIDERDHELERVLSVYSIVMDLHERSFHIAEGPVCEHEYQHLQLGGAAAVAPAGRRPAGVEK